MVIICVNCGSSEVLQQFTVMLDPNDVDAFADVRGEDLEYSGFEFCTICEDETKTTDTEDA